RLPLVIELYPIEPGELPEAQVDDVLRLALGELVFPAQRLLRRGLVFARTDELDDVVDLRVREQAPEDDLDALLHSVEPELLAPLLLLRDLLLAEAGLGIGERLDLLHHLAHRHAVRQLAHHDAPLGAREVLALPLAAQHERAAAGLVRLPDFLRRRDD